MKDSKIQWTDHTFNPWIGCTKVHTGCENCYAEELMANRYKRVEWGPTGARSRTKNWGEPIKWNAEAMKAFRRDRVFCASLADVFEPRDEITPWRRDLFDLIDRCLNLDWLLLTKRPHLVNTLWPDTENRHNVWIGTSVSDQRTAEEFIFKLAMVSFGILRFLSIEPLVGPVALSDVHLRYVDWVIVGGESGPNARPLEVEWIESIVGQCKDANVPVFVKQLGSNVDIPCQSRKGDLLEEMPETIRYREFPS